MSVLRWLASFVRTVPPHASTDIDEELAHHLELLRRDEIAAGADPAEANARALARFGDPERHARACRGVAFGVFTMKRGLFIGWNVALALALLFTFVIARDAHRRSMGVPPQLSTDTRTAILRSLWTRESGEIQVTGAVARPGGIATSLTKPLSVAQLLEMSGASPDAQLVTMVLPGRQGEMYVSVENAYRHRDETQLMPEPGTVITIK